MMHRLRSPQVKAADFIPPEDKKNYSYLQVLESAAGFYIGTVYTTPEGFMEPGSRDSEYFPSRAVAEEHLRNRTWYQRMDP